jgi:hypothetical protein
MFTEMAIDFTQFTLIDQGECAITTEGPRKDVGH